MAESLRVLHLDDGREWRGGQHQVFLLATGLRERGHRPIVMTPPGSPLAERSIEAGVEIELMDFKGEWDRRAARAIAERVAGGGADLVHAHTAHAHAVGLRASRLWSRAGAAAPFVVSRRVDFPVGGNWFSRRKYRDPNQRFIAISTGVAEALRAGGVAAERIEIVPSGVPPIPADRALDRDRARRRLKIPDGCAAIVNVGALTDHKGHRWLIEAAERTIERRPDAQFWIFGEGELRGELDSRVEALGLRERVHLPGHVPEIRNQLAAFDLYVSSSHMEGLGTSILDAMLAGLPVVAAAAGGVPDAVRDGETGRLVAPRDAMALADAILESRALPEEAARAQIERARRFVEERFSARAMVEGTLEVYRRLLADPTRSAANARIASANSSSD